MLALSPTDTHVETAVPFTGSAISEKSCRAVAQHMNETSQFYWFCVEAINDPF
ncbi:MAG: hypothetical protein GOVbin4933_24 [Prokaryotic dsDNA virus sp.]|nr:MAG: hypothetical protein GOVbin4933_24 [Prokaryotic dsDNA virus sp.]